MEENITYNQIPAVEPFPEPCAFCLDTNLLYRQKLELILIFPSCCSSFSIYQKRLRYFKRVNPLRYFCRHHTSFLNFVVKYIEGRKEKTTASIWHLIWVFTQPLLKCIFKGNRNYGQEIGRIKFELKYKHIRKGLKRDQDSIARCI